MIDFANVKAITIPEGRVRLIHIAGNQAWKGAALNLVKTAIDIDGSVYNETGYMEDYRLNSSGAITVQNGAIHSGYISYTFGGAIRAAGSTAGLGASGQYIAFYDAGFACVKSVTTSSIVNATASESTYELTQDGIYILTVLNISAFFEKSFADIDTSEIRYIRVSMANCSGADFVVTIDEEII